MQQPQELQMRIKLQQLLLEGQSTNEYSTSYHANIPLASPSDYSNWSSPPSTSSQQSNWNARSYSPSEVEPIQQTVGSSPIKKLLLSFCTSKTHETQRTFVNVYFLIVYIHL